MEKNPFEPPLPLRAEDKDSGPLTVLLRATAPKLLRPESGPLPLPLLLPPARPPDKGPLPSESRPPPPPLPRDCRHPRALLRNDANLLAVRGVKALGPAAVGVAVDERDSGFEGAAAASS